MNGVDIIILCVIVAFLVKGVLRGLLKEVCSLLGLVLGGFLAFRYQGPLAEVLLESWGWPTSLGLVAAFLALFLACVVFFGLVGYLLSRFVKLVLLGGVNRIAGAFFGLAQGVLILALVLFALSLRPLPAGLSGYVKASQLAPPLVTLGRQAMTGSRVLFSGD